MTSEDNAKKSQHGKNAQNGIFEMLTAFKNKKYLKNVIQDYRNGYKEYDPNQFYATFMITFEDLEKWLIFSTTSYRSDRMKGPQWDAFNLKNIDEKIKRAYYVYPDGISKKEKEAFVKANKQIINNKIVSSINQIISQTEFSKLIEEKHYANKKSGMVHDAKGRIFEDIIAQILSSEENLAKLKTNDPIKTGLHYDIFCKIITAFNLNVQNTRKIDASSSKEVIGFLPFKGQPKTDVFVEIKFDDDSSQIFTISCKRTNCNCVSVHQYPASKFVEVLDSKNVRLKELLLDFQKVGGVRAFGKENEAELTKELKPYLEKLALWVFGGFGGDGDATKHFANFFISYSDETNDISIHSIKEYYKLLLSQNIKGQFGTVFSWTFASGQKGKSIQLKTKII